MFRTGKLRYNRPIRDQTPDYLNRLARNRRVIVQKVLLQFNIFTKVRQCLDISHIGHIIFVKRFLCILYIYVIFTVSERVF